MDTDESPSRELRRSLFEPAIEVVGYATVAVEQGVDIAPRGLTYAVPRQLADLAAGERVRAPLGRGDRVVEGHVIALLPVDDPSVRRPDRIKPILERVDHQVRLTGELLELARWMAAYYCCPLGMTLPSMLPSAVTRDVGRVTRTMVRLARASADPPAPGVAQLDEPASTSAQRQADGDAAADPPRPPRKLSRLQKAALAAAEQAAVSIAHGEGSAPGVAGRLADAEGWIDIHALAEAAGAKSVAPVRQLIERGLLETVMTTSIHARQDQTDPDGGPRPGETSEPHALAASSPDPTLDPLPGVGFTLTEDQRQAVDALTEALSRGFNVNLLHGVTGSGKTEVYLRVIEALHARHAEDPAGPPGVIVLVPEIALTPQTVARFTGRLDRVAVLHSGLTAAQRHQQWRRLASGEAWIVVGARSAIFAPMPRVGLIIVDEEHEPSYKQDQAPRYHARDVAIKRAHLAQATVVLGSATPSLESYARAVLPCDPATGQPTWPGRLPDATAAAPDSAISPGPPRARWRLIEMPRRAANFQLPNVEIVNMIDERRRRRGVHLLSQRLEASIHQTLQAGRQVMILLNRRGYANYIACPDQTCGWLMTCDHCDVTMVYHKDAHLPDGGVVRCHHCGAEKRLPVTCETCGRKVSIFGLGTQRVQSELERKFEGVPLQRMDSDVMRTGRDYHHALERFRRGEVRILLGTQMIAKGLDFPGVSLVGVISADTSLHMPDFRASERTFQLIAQVAGRAGRSETPGRVIVQTFNPQDPAIDFASRHDYRGFAEHELATRASVAPPLPPFMRMARLVIRHADAFEAIANAQALADLLAEANDLTGGAVHLRGPAPCAIARVADFHRQQIEMRAASASSLQRLLVKLRNAGRLVSDAATAVDVDPVSVL